MAFYVSDLYPLKMRALEALDKGMTLSFQSLRDSIASGEFRELINAAGCFPMPEIPDPDWQEITDSVENVLFTQRNEESRRFYIGENGYCLLIAVLLEIRRDCMDIQRP